MSSSALAIISNLYAQECWLNHRSCCLKSLSHLYEFSSVLVNVKHFCCDCQFNHRISGYNPVVPVFKSAYLNNRLISSCLKPLFQRKAKCEAIDMKMNFYSHASKTHFHNKWSISTRKTTISIYYCLPRLIVDLNLKLVITKVYGVQAKTIEGQNAFAPLLCFAQVLLDR